MEKSIRAEVIEVHEEGESLGFYVALSSEGVPMPKAKAEDLLRTFESFVAAASMLSGYRAGYQAEPE